MQLLRASPQLRRSWRQPGYGDCTSQHNIASYIFSSDSTDHYIIVKLFNSSWMAIMLWALDSGRLTSDEQTALAHAKGWQLVKTDCGEQFCCESIYFDNSACHHPDSYFVSARCSTKVKEYHIAGANSKC